MGRDKQKQNPPKQPCGRCVNGWITTFSNSGGGQPMRCPNGCPAG